VYYFASVLFVFVLYKFINFSFLYSIHSLFETEYVFNDPLASFISHSSSSSNSKSVLKSKLDADFFDNDDDNNFNKLEQYISEKPANKEIDVLAWWKVSVFFCLIIFYNIKIFAFLRPIRFSFLDLQKWLVII